MTTNGTRSFIPVAIAVLCYLSIVHKCKSLSPTGAIESSPQPYSFLILGGTGRIGTAVASQLLLRSPQSKVILVGRDIRRGRDAVSEVVNESPVESGSRKLGGGQVTYQCFDWKNNDALTKAVADCDCLIHTAGPFLDEKPSPLAAAIESKKCRVYVDVSDPLDFLDESLKMKDRAVKSGTSALLSAGAFPGMSNVLAVEAASCLPDTVKVRDVRFNYFTAGLGGSGDVNLYITNLGFGEPMTQYDRGKLTPFQALSGSLLGKVSFFLDKADGGGDSGFGNEAVKSRIGSKTVFSWPFPEAATVARELRATGDSSAAMGTAPNVWNTMLGILVSIVPRSWWRSKRFSKFLADFSNPLVKATDALLRVTSPDGLGETHAMRIDVTGEDSSAVSVIQAHESFRRCVGQSCAEFALDLLEYPLPGVWLPEQRYRDEAPRARIMQRLAAIPGTFAFIGPVNVRKAAPPSDMASAIEKAKRFQLNH